MPMIFNPVLPSIRRSLGMQDPGPKRGDSYPTSMSPSNGSCNTLILTSVLLDPDASVGYVQVQASAQVADHSPPETYASISKSTGVLLELEIIQEGFAGDGVCRVWASWVILEEEERGFSKSWL